MSRPDPVGIARAARSAGFTIVELMIGMLLGILIVLGMINMFASSSATYETQAALSEMQENSRFALEEIARTVRSAGFVGCVRDAGRIDSALADQASYYGNVLAGVQAYNADADAWLPAAPAELTQPVTGSDLLVLRSAEQGSIFVTQAMAATTDAVRITPGHAGTTFEPGDLALVTNCFNSSVFQVTATDPVNNELRHLAAGVNPGNDSDQLGAVYDAGSQVLKLETVAYYVRDDANGVPNLYRKREDGAPQPLVEGIEQLQVLLGEDLDGDQIADQYVTADLVVAPVVTVRLSMLTVSRDELGIDVDTRPVVVGDVVVPAANDRRLRRVFTKTISLRNRLP